MSLTQFRAGSHRFIGPLMAMTLGLHTLAGAAEQRTENVQIAMRDHPLARCNNGEPATFQVRLSTHDGSGPVDYRKKWLVVLSGGGQCSSEATCLARWREGPDAATNNIPFDQDTGPGDHFNMVPNLGRRDLDGNGILDFDGERAPQGQGVVGRDANPFRGPSPHGQDGFNRVWVPYCSSDSWQGLGTRVAVDPRRFRAQAFDPSNGALSHLYFGGARIVDAVIATILAGQVPGTTEAHTPRGADAEVVLAGSSAGGGGTIRNLDDVAARVQAHDPAVKVYGIADAGSAVGILPDVVVMQNDPTVPARFYASGDISRVRTGLNCPAGQPRCHSIPSIVVRDHVATPYMVVQQAFDTVVHGAEKDQLTDALRNRRAFLQQHVPVLYQWSLNASLPPSVLAELYIRNATTRTAPQIGLLRNNPAALWIPNFAHGWHQLLTSSRRFLVSPTEPDPMWTDGHGHPEPGSPRLGPLYRGSNMRLADAIGNFRRCAIGSFGAFSSYTDCIQTINTGQGMVEGNARVINSTAVR